MILTMAYLTLIASLTGLAAHFGERLCAELGWPRRSAWLVMLIASLALPALAYVSGARPTATTPLLSLPPLFDQLPLVSGGLATGAAATTQTSSFNWPDWQLFDSAFAMLWIISSSALLLLYLLAGWRMRGVTRKARTLVIGEQPVLVSDRLGPAVLGFLRPRIVLPRWLAEQDTALRAQVLEHEREHIAARDQLVLIGALVIVAVMPWNVALWWQLRRLRAAMEVDCDGRVLRAGSNPRDYAEALLTVGRRARRAPFAAVALTEPVSELEKRIRIMLARARGLSPAGFGARFLLVASMLGLAVAVNAPNAQQASDESGSVSAPTAAPALRMEVADQFAAAQACMEQDDLDCARRVLDEIGEIPDLNAYETGQLQNFYAFLAFNADDIAGAITAYETILDLPPEALPAGLISGVMRNLAMLYLQEDRIEDGLALYDRWLALPFVNVTGNDRYLRASMLYQLERYPEAIADVESAIAATENPQENWYQLLYAMQWMTEDQAGAARTLEILNSRWPDNPRAGTPTAENPGLPGAAFVGASDSEYLPVVRVAPVYPPRPQARGIEGYVVVRYTVTTTGATEDVEVVESSSSLFDAAAVEAASKYEYRPRVIDGIAVEVAGVTSRIEFKLPQDD